MTAPAQPECPAEIVELVNRFAREIGGTVFHGRPESTGPRTALLAAIAALAKDAAQTPAARDVLAERERQKNVEGWWPEHDDEHDDMQMAFAASCYCVADTGEAPPAVWPWEWKFWKPRDHRANLVRAGALILAEIERLDRHDAAIQEASK